MITAYLMGGLGNQLFQIFATIATSMKYNKQFFFIYSDKLNVGKERPTYWYSLLSGIRSYVINMNSEYPMKQYNDPNIQYKEIPNPKEYLSDMPTNSVLLLHGYFQFYKHFIDYQTRIYDLINLYEQLEQTREVSPLRVQGAISIHFRLDDYVNHQEYHNILSVEYYIKCIRAIQKEDNAVTNVLVFYQEIDTDMVETNYMSQLRKEFPTLVFTYIDHKKPDWQQMLTMAICKYNVIANSTFSWWGAYLNQTPDSVHKVYYPAQWFGPALRHYDVSEMFPPHWNRITDTP